MPHASTPRAAEGLRLGPGPSAVADRVMRAIAAGAPRHFRLQAEAQTDGMQLALARAIETILRR
jgi:hypothetical protein